MPFAFFMRFKPSARGNCNTSFSLFNVTTKPELNIHPVFI